MEKQTKQITEYIMDAQTSLFCESDASGTKIYYYKKDRDSMRQVAKGPAVIANLDEEMEKVAQNLREMEEDTDFSEKLIIDTTSQLWKTCKSETEFLAKLASMVAGTIQTSYTDMRSAAPGTGFALDEQNVEVSVLKAMHRVAEILFSAQSRDGMVNAKANDDERTRFT